MAENKKMTESEILLNAILQVLTQLITTSYLNAFYSALILKKQSGVEITFEIQESVLDDIFSKGLVIHKRVIKAMMETMRQKEPFRPT